MPLDWSNWRALSQGAQSDEVYSVTGKRPAIWRSA
jgi:hypothetical protein